MLHVKPTVEVGSNIKGPWQQAREKTSLRYGQWIRCRQGGQADLLFNNGTDLVLHQASIQLVRPASNNDPMVIRLVGALSSVFVRSQHKTVIRLANDGHLSQGSRYARIHTPENLPTGHGC